MPDLPANIVPINPDAHDAAKKFSAEHDRELLTILFTDLVDSTKLQSDSGNMEAARLTELHRELVRAELARYSAREIEWAGDSCLAVFTKPSEAVVFALRMQAEHRRVRETEPKLPTVRVGMHLGEIVVKKGPKKEDLFGLQISEAARVMSIARGNQVFCTRAVFDSARSSLKGQPIEGIGDAVWVNYGAYLLKGSEDPVEICEIGSAEVAVMKAPEANEKVFPLLPGGVGAGKSQGTPRWAMAIVVLLLVGVSILAGSLALDLRGSGGRATNVQAPIRSLAVLPFENNMGDATKEYYVDGMTDTLTAELSKIASIKVIARTSAMRFKGSDKPLREIAQALGVEGLIEGSVQLFGDELRITAQLVDGRTEEHLWGENFEGTLAGVMKLQGEVAVSIADQIGAVLTPEARDYASAKDVNPEAYDLYLQGRSIMQSRLENDVRIALNLFEKAIALDPEFALPHSGMADVHSLMRYFGYASGDETKETAFMHARKAIELDDSLAEAHASLGFAYALFDIDRNWAASERAFQRAIELNPGFVRARTWHGWLLTELGQTSEALSEMRVAAELDPLDPIALGALGRVLRLSQRYEEAEEALLAANVMDPLLSFPFDELSRMYQSIGRIDDALQAAQKVYDITRSPDAEWNVMFLGAALKGSETLRSLVAEVERGEHDGFSPRSLVNLYLAVGDDTMALTHIQDYILSSYKGAMRVRSTERFHSLEPDPRDRRYLGDDPRFWAMLDKYNLPPLPPEHPRYAKEQAFLRQKAAEAALAAQPKPVRRLSIVLPPEHSLSMGRMTAVDEPKPALTMSHDGSMIAVVLTRAGARQIFTRELDSFDMTPVADTENAYYPFFSPDDRTLGFFGMEALRRVGVSGTGAMDLAPITESWAGLWTARHGIITGTKSYDGLQLVSPEGGVVKQFAMMDYASGHQNYIFPHLMPDEDVILITIYKGGSNMDGDIAALSLGEEGAVPRIIVRGGSNPFYVDPGFLIYARADELFAARFDPDTLEVGPPTLVFKGVLADVVYHTPQYFVSSGGHLLYAPGAPPVAAFRLVWLNKDGSVEDVVEERAGYDLARLSPDGRRIVYSSRGRDQDIWLIDLDRAISEPLLSGPSLDFSPNWAGKNGSHIIFASIRTGAINIYKIPSSGEGVPEAVVPTSNPRIQSTSAHEIDRIVYSEQTPSGVELWSTTLSGDEPPRKIEGVTSSFFALSPDGRWLAYETKVGNTREVFVISVSGGRGRRVSADGGSTPIWSRQGDELFYKSLDESWLMGVSIETDPNLSIGVPRQIVETRNLDVQDVDLTGERFLAVEEPDPPVVTRLEVVLNWIEEVKAQLAAAEAN